MVYVQEIETVWPKDQENDGIESRERERDRE